MGLKGGSCGPTECGYYKYVFNVIKKSRELGEDHTHEKHYKGTWSSHGFRPVWADQTTSDDESSQFSLTLNDSTNDLCQKYREMRDDKHSLFWNTYGSHLEKYG